MPRPSHRPNKVLRIVIRRPERKDSRTMWLQSGVSNPTLLGRYGPNLISVDEFTHTGTTFQRKIMD